MCYGGVSTSFLRTFFFFFDGFDINDPPGWQNELRIPAAGAMMLSLRYESYSSHFFFVFPKSDCWAVEIKGQRCLMTNDCIAGEVTDFNFPIKKWCDGRVP